MEVSEVSRTAEAPSRHYRTWTLDSRRWESWRPREGDIVIATYPKCGTTWMQRIVSLLIFRSSDPLPLMDISPWIDKRFGEPLDVVIGRIEAQGHRRFLKSHLPLDGLPLHPGVKYIHVARDGRDACMSYHNHAMGLTETVREHFDRIGLEDETIARPFPRVPEDPADYFHRWVRNDNVPHLPFLDFERSWWNGRARENVLHVHYNDLKAGLGAEMRRIASFLGASIPEGEWATLVDAASFDSMRKQGDALLAATGKIFKEGGERFFFKGSNERWRGVFRDDDLAAYESSCASLLEPACARWLAGGRGSGDPRAP